jgi:cell division protein FtsN
MDDLGALIATLPFTPSIPAPSPATRSESAKSGLAQTNNSGYFLQAGAYSVMEDAEALKARIILLGLPASVQYAEVNGKKINRVRVGPFARPDEMERARARLQENKIDSRPVRP